MFIVMFNDYDATAYDSMWHDEELAQKRADEATASCHRGYKDWEVKEIELGDPVDGEYDWDKHAADKQAARDQDVADVKSGKYTVAEIRKRNSMWTGFDFSKVVVIAPDGTRFKQPR